MQFDSRLVRYLACIGLLSTAALAPAQVVIPPATAQVNTLRTLALDHVEPSSGYIEAGVLYHTLTAGYPDWRGVFLRGGWRSDAKNYWTSELVRSQQFDDQGTLGVIGNTHVINDLWYSTVSVSGSTGGFYLPEFRVDASLSRKWFERRNFVTTAGITAINANDGHKDKSLLLAAAYYFESPFVLEGGIRLNNSNPGSVRSNAQYVALTYGVAGNQIMSLRYGFGEEAYQYITPDALLVNFNSYIWTGTWRKWVTSKQGFQVRAEAYHNSYYDRQGIELSVFQEF